MPRGGINPAIFVQGVTPVGAGGRPGGQMLQYGQMRRQDKRDAFDQEMGRSQDARAGEYLRLQQRDQQHRFTKQEKAEQEATIAEWEAAAISGDESRIARARDKLRRVGLEPPESADAAGTSAPQATSGKLSPEPAKPMSKGDAKVSSEIDKYVEREKAKLDAIEVEYPDGFGATRPVGSWEAPKHDGPLTATLPTSDAPTEGAKLAPLPGAPPQAGQAPLPGQGAVPNAPAQSAAQSAPPTLPGQVPPIGVGQVRDPKTGQVLASVGAGEIGQAGRYIRESLGPIMESAPDEEHRKAAAMAIEAAEGFSKWMSPQEAAKLGLDLWKLRTEQIEKPKRAGRVGMGGGGGRFGVGKDDIKGYREMNSDTLRWITTIKDTHNFKVTSGQLKAGESALGLLNMAGRSGLSDVVVVKELAKATEGGGRLSNFDVQQLLEASGHLEAFKSAMKMWTDSGMKSDKYMRDVRNVLLEAYRTAEAQAERIGRIAYEEVYQAHSHMPEDVARHQAELAYGAFTGKFGQGRGDNAAPKKAAAPASKSAGKSASKSGDSDIARRRKEALERHRGKR
jgi:hypothetical protein